MSEKMTCPACDAHTSSILRAFAEGQPCPACGLPADAAVAVLGARARGADAELVQRTIDAEQRAAKAEKRVRELEWRIGQVESALKDEPPEYIHESYLWG